MSITFKTPTYISVLNIHFYRYKNITPPSSRASLQRRRKHGIQSTPVAFYSCPDILTTKKFNHFFPFKSLCKGVYDVLNYITLSGVIFLSCFSTNTAIFVFATLIFTSLRKNIIIGFLRKNVRAWLYFSPMALLVGAVEGNQLKMSVKVKKHFKINREREW